MVSSIPPVVIFLPETGIEPYARSLAVLADAGRTAGQRVLVTKCTGQLTYCLMMAMHEVSLEDVPMRKKSLCAICCAKHDEICTAYGFEPLNLSQIAIPADEIAKKSDAESHDLGSVKYAGFSVGTMAAYDFSLSTKQLYSPEVSPDHLELMRAFVHNTMQSLAYARGIIQLYMPAVILCFNEYAACQAVRFCAYSSNIHYVAVSLPMHMGICGALSYCSNDLLPVYTLKHLAQWPNVCDLPISEKAVNACFDDVIFRSYGDNSHLFSPNKETALDALCDNIGVNISKKICVVYTSSLDERYGLDSSLTAWNINPDRADAFESQIEWLQYLQSFVATRDDVQVIVRIHPREGTRKRKGVSGHLVQLQAAFAEQTPDFIIVWPDDPVSSYDLMELADVVLVAWSTMGVESFRVGVPVLAWAGNMYYVDSKCMRVATTKESYFTVLDEMLHQAPTFEQLSEGIRYYYWRTFIPCIDMAETVDSNPYLSSYWPKAPDSRRSIIQEIMQGKVADPVDYNVFQWKAALNESSQDSEQRAIVDGLRALIEVTFCPPQHKPVPLWYRVVRKAVRILTKKNLVWQNSTVPQVQDFTHLQLECLSGQQKDSDLRQRTRKNNNLRVLVSNGNENAYYRHGICLHRTSKLISRLGSYIAAFHSAASNDL